MNTSRFLIAALLVASTFGMSEPRQAQAQYGVSPWGHNAFYGPVPRRVRYRYTARYAPRDRIRYGYGAPMAWGANYGGVNQASYYGPETALPSSFHRPTSFTSNYGPSYYGGGYISPTCGCNPCGSNCGISNCGSGNCASGDCATTSGSSYSPDPVVDTKQGTGGVTPTFKPTTTEEAPVPDLKDDFEPVNRREKDSESKNNESTGGFISPKLDASPAGSTIPNTPGSTIPNTPASTIPSGNSEAPPSTIPSGSSVLPNGAVPMAPITRPVAPPVGGSTIPDTSNRSTIPGGENSTIPSSKPFPNNTKPPETLNLQKPAVGEPSPEEKTPALLLEKPETSVKPLEIESAPVAKLVIGRRRVVMQAGYRMPALSRIDVPTQPILEAGSSKLAIR